MSCSALARASVNVQGQLTSTIVGMARKPQVLNLLTCMPESQAEADTDIEVPEGEQDRPLLTSAVRNLQDPSADSSRGCVSS